MTVPCAKETSELRRGGGTEEPQSNMQGELPGQQGDRRRGLLCRLDSVLRTVGPQGRGHPLF